MKRHYASDMLGEEIKGKKEPLHQQCVAHFVKIKPHSIPLSNEAGHKTVCLELHFNKNSNIYMCKCLERPMPES